MNRQLSNIGTIKEIMTKYGFSFSKSLGQNFIINPSVCPKMAQNSVTDENTCVIEIGPGIGVLTCELAKRAKKVVAIELDKRLLPVLKETLEEFDNVKVINADILKIDLHELIQKEFGENKDVVVCANLPYYITSPVIMKLLEEHLPIQSVTVMVQKETAQRICADVGTRLSGAVTVAVHYYCQPELLFNVSAGSFMPAPKVDSAVIRLAVSNTPNVTVLHEKNFFKVVKAAFSQRRKTLSNALSSGLSLPKNEVNAMLNTLQIPANYRAEQLSLEQFAELSDYLTKCGVLYG